jgi:RHS repeat-associated protein
VTGVSYVGISPDLVEMSDGSGDSGLDSFGRIIETWWKKGPDVMQKASDGYDRASNRKWRRDDLAHDLGGTQATRHDNFYWYDGLDQVIGRELGELVGTPPNYTGITGAIQDESWSYDATGNWLKYDSAAEANLQQTRCHNAANEITHVANPGGVIQPSYDEVGNQTLDIAPGDWDRGFSLKWDAWNRLIEVKDGNTLIQTNAYDGLSRRITSSDGTDMIHYYYNDAWRSVEEYTDADPDDPACRYLWGLRSRWDLVKRERSDSGTLDEKRYVLYDAMDPVAICDEDGEVVQRFEYSPFGRTTFLDPDFTPGAPGDWTFLFHGEFRDEDTGYYNYGYRYYTPMLGRWPSRDPIGEIGGINLYIFVKNNGIRYTDLLGLEKRDCKWTIYHGHGATKDKFWDSKTCGELSELANTVGELPCGDRLGHNSCHRKDMNELIERLFPGCLLPSANKEHNDVTWHNSRDGDIPTDEKHQPNSYDELSKLWNDSIKDAEEACKDNDNCCKSITIEVKCPDVDYQRIFNKNKVKEPACGSTKTINCE